ncbi:MAG: DUF1846 family C-terminal domain-containing protein, partial [Oscillospiraceae bacterium]
GYVDKSTLQHIELILNEINVNPTDRPVVKPALEYLEKLKKINKDENLTVVALKLEDGTIITGRNSTFMSATSACILNAIKQLSNIDDNIHLIAPTTIDPIISLKKDTLEEVDQVLNAEEILLALSISAVINTAAKTALDNLEKIKNLEAHSTTILNRSDEQILKKLNINVTCEAEFLSKSLYYNN